MFQLVYRWFLRAAWAPIAVLLIQQVFSRSSGFDFVMHFFGGAAMAFFIYQGIAVFESRIGQLLPFIRHLLTFGLTCAVIIAWELCELTSDRFFGTGFQASVTETMGDQLCGVAGSIFTLGCIAAAHFAKRSDS